MNGSMLNVRRCCVLIQQVCVATNDGPVLRNGPWIIRRKPEVRRIEFIVRLLAVQDQRRVALPHFGNLASRDPKSVNVLVTNISIHL